MPELIELGHLYIAQPPLYKVSRGKAVRYIKDDEEMNAYLLEEGCAKALLRLGSGEERSGADLVEIAAQAQAIQPLLQRLSSRAPAFAIEQALIAGALTPAASDAALERLAKRLNQIADEGEDSWQAELGGEGNNNIVMERSVRDVREQVVFDEALLTIADARKLQQFQESLQRRYEGQGEFIREEVETPIYGPQSLLEAVMKAGRKGISIQRYKGLGEMNADQLWETSLDPDARSLLQVKIEHVVAADELFTRLMGDVVEPRRDFIRSNALDAEIDA